MDTTETYIRMCDCPEIQSIVKPAHTVASAWKTGDYVANAKLLKVTIFSGIQRPSRKLVWLPRQDQLQEMVYPETSYPVSHLLIRINEFYNKLEYWGEDAGEITMEQLWLAFVMKEKYNKVWDGKEWAERL